MRVAAQNLWGRRGDWPARRSVLVDGLRNLQPDLFAFHEAIVTDEYDQVRDLLGSEFFVAHLTAREVNRGGDVEDGQGLSLASRWPLDQVYELDLHVTHRTADFACGLLAAELRAPDPIGPLLFVAYGPSWKLNLEYERELQAVAAARFIEEIIGQRSMHVVIGGDFNADPNAASVRFWTGRQSLAGTSVCYRDAWESIHPGEPGDTFTPLNPLMADWDWPFRRIDDIFVRCGEHGGPSLVIRACERIFDQPIDAVWASDHFGLMADLEVPPQAGR